MLEASEQCQHAHQGPHEGGDEDEHETFDAEFNGGSCHGAGWMVVDCRKLLGVRVVAY